MHNTSTEYKQMHNQTISWNNNWILIFICLVGRLLEPSASYLLIHLSILDKRFFNSCVLNIPHRLRDLLWIVRAWSSVAPIFSSLIMSLASSCVHTSQSLLKVITSFWNTLLEWMNPMIMGGHSKYLILLRLLRHNIEHFLLVSSRMTHEGWDDL